ncbi:hypothetical protein [Synechococcus phage ME01]
MNTNQLFIIYLTVIVAAALLTASAILYCEALL